MTAKKDYSFDKGFDVKKLRSMSKDIKKQAQGGGDLFLYANKLPEALDIRILPSPDVSNGAYFIQQEKWWINGKTFLVNSTPYLGGVDVIQEEVDKARNSGDKDLIALLDKKNQYQIPMVKKEYTSLIPCLVINTEYDDDDELVKMEVDRYAVLVVKVQLLDAIHTIVTSRPYQNKTKYGIADREKGWNLIVGKTGKGLDTKYTAMGWNEQTEVPENWYDFKKMPNVFALTDKAAKSDEYLRSVIRNYLYGEEIVEDSTPVDDVPAKKADAPKKTTHKRPTQKAETPAPKKEESRSLLEDAENTIGDDDDLDDL